MKNRTPLPQDSTAEQLEIARVRAEVQRALAQDPPDLDRLTAALERVDTLIESAQAALVAALSELHPLRARPSAHIRSVLEATQTIVRGGFARISS